jgi:hypothetical protein
MRAYRDTISFDGESGPGVIVDFDKSWRLLFWTKLWAGASQWDMGDDLWITNEWMEVNSIEDTRWFEPMMDVEARYSRLDILERSLTVTQPRMNTIPYIQTESRCEDWLGGPGTRATMVGTQTFGSLGSLS